MFSLSEPASIPLSRSSSPATDEVNIESVSTRIHTIGGSSPIAGYSCSESTLFSSEICLNASPSYVKTVKLPVYALSVIVMGTALLCVALCVLIVLPLYLKVKRDHQSISRSFDGRPTSRLSRSSRLARSRPSSTNAVSISGLGSESYRQPVDAMTMTYHTDGHESITRSNIVRRFCIFQVRVLLLISFACNI